MFTIINILACITHVLHVCSDDQKRMSERSQIFHVMFFMFVVMIFLNTYVKHGKNTVYGIDDTDA